MHLLTLTETIDLGPKDKIVAGVYISEDVNGAQLMNLAGGGSMTPFTERRPFDDTQDWNGKRILIERAGGFGDIVQLTPSCREIKRRWPKCFLTVSTMDHYAVVLKNLPFVDSTVSYPLPLEIAKTYDAWVFLENAIERNPRARSMHMADLFAEIIGLRGKPGLAGAGGHPALDDNKAAYQVTPNEMIWVMEQYPRVPGKCRITIQPKASARLRNYPNEQFKQVIEGLLAKGWEVFLLSHFTDGVKVPEVEGLYNLVDFNTTFRQSCAVINNSDVHLGPDSALVHIAGALNVPAVGLYGPFPWELRTKYADQTFSLTGNKLPCSPCFHHPNPYKGANDEFPANCPSRKTGYCEVLSSIKPERILQKIDQIAKKAPLEVRA